MPVELASNSKVREYTTAAGGRIVTTTTTSERNGLRETTSQVEAFPKGSQTSTFKSSPVEGGAIARYLQN